MTGTEITSLSELVTRIRVTHHVTTRVLLDEMAHAMAHIAVTVPVSDLPKVEVARRGFAFFRDDMLAHLLAEERTVFLYIVGLEQALAGVAPPPHAAFHSVASPIQLMKNEQENAERALCRLEADLVAARRPGTPALAWMRLDGLLMKLRADLAEHTAVEQLELFPAALELEQHLVALRMTSSTPSSRR